MGNSYDPRYMVTEKFINHKQSLIVLMTNGLGDDVVVKRISIYDTYTNLDFEGIELHPNMGSDHEKYWYAKQVEKCNKLNRDHNRYLADIIEICEKIYL